MAIGTNTVLQVASRAEYGFKNIPVIDMKDADNDPAVRRQIAKDILDACVNVGFFYVKNHGILEELMFDALEVGKKFFALPEETKLKYDSRTSSNLKGYTAFLSENIDPENRGDLHEGYDVCPEPEPDASAEANGNGSWGVNRWPEEVPGFKEAYLKYYKAATAFGKKLFPLFALALGVDETFFDDKTKGASAFMRVLHYPPQTGPHDDRILGIGAHTDFECFTILWQEPGIEALQVLNANKEWINATPIPGTLVINIADQFMRWTNDVFKSTVHRAINRTGVERYSIPLFFGADYNVRLDPIPTCVSADRLPRYDVVTAGEYSEERLRVAYKNAVKAN
ncbi:Clavaminate synthase-like protein [Fomitiporia mediterranea MF3/22]|uniref:Clavaminate synthase-like protein n=1 Tax=Fomitiporia mediterranea (strain MF3/22) TaxID=694068 RepID=UPI00044089E6|nr:Clavaminate synthase-like protein [Fomitiporia mediterranea MF3/22]EJC97850.1 Clavaminate synthase-like protein [Fomitiporia mediterranea MF3/22]